MSGSDSSLSSVPSDFSMPSAPKVLPASPVLSDVTLYSFRTAPTRSSFDGETAREQWSSSRSTSLCPTEGATPPPPSSGKMIDTLTPTCQKELADSKTCISQLEGSARPNGPRFPVSDYYKQFDAFSGYRPSDTADADDRSMQEKTEWDKLKVATWDVYHAVETQTQPGEVSIRDEACEHIVQAWNSFVDQRKEESTRADKETLALEAKLSKARKPIGRSTTATGRFTAMSMRSSAPKSSRGSTRVMKPSRRVLAAGTE